MTHINFYHLTVTPLGKALPRLLEKVLQNDMRAMVITANTEQVEQLNKELWTYTTKVFLPHGTKEDGFEAQQPIYITQETDDIPNQATVVACVGDAMPSSLQPFEKCLYLFDAANENELQLARKRWKALKEQDYTLIYWQQTKKGGWESKDA